jgi:hypothetical protein
MGMSVGAGVEMSDEESRMLEEAVVEKRDDSLEMSSRLLRECLDDYK